MGATMQATIMQAAALTVVPHQADQRAVALDSMKKATREEALLTIYAWLSIGAGCSDWHICHSA